MEVDGGRGSEAVDAPVPIKREPCLTECLPCWVVASLCLLLRVSSCVGLAFEGVVLGGAWVAAGAVWWDGGSAPVVSGSGAGADDWHGQAAFLPLRVPAGAACP